MVIIYYNDLYELEPHNYRLYTMSSGQPESWVTIDHPTETDRSKRVHVASCASDWEKTDVAIYAARELRRSRQIANVTIRYILFVN